MTDNTVKKSHEYFDSPDGEDCLRKIGIITKYGTITGLTASTLDILLYSHPKGIGRILGRYAYITLPIMGIGAAFSAAVCTSANIRNKDDKVNYALGGLASAAVWGAWRKSFKVAVYGGFFLGLMAIVVKDSYQNDWPLLLHERPKMHTTPYWAKQDWSLTSDPGRTWKRSNE